MTKDSQQDDRLAAAEARFELMRKRVGLWLGPLAFLALLVFPVPAPSAEAARLAAVLVLALVWWITEAVPIPVTALLAPALAVVMGIGTAQEMFAPFGDPIVMMFLGGFLLAEAMSETGLDRRVAGHVLGHRWVGGSPARVLVAFVLLCAGVSAWMNNTSTTAMLYPIALSVLAAMARGAGRDPKRLRFGTALMLGLAWAASIGGVMTPVGSAPNLIAIGQLQKLTDERIPFLHWAAIGVPLALTLLGFLLVYFRWVLPPDVEPQRQASRVLAGEAVGLPMSRGERQVVAAFAITVFFWVLPGAVAAVLGTSDPVAAMLQKKIPESVVAILGASLLFLMPPEPGTGRRPITWQVAGRIDWGTLMLFGGGLALGGAMFRTGLAASLGNGLVSFTGSTSLVALTCLFCWISILLTETTSNTATATMLTPLGIAAAQAAGVPAAPVAMAIAFGASMAFMLPVSTPPNAIVYGSGSVRITQMARHGAVLDLVAAALIPPVVLVGCHLLGLA